MSVRTKAALLRAPYDIDLIERELICGEDDVIVKNHLIGICGSDKSFYRGDLPSSQEPKYPFLFGHESGGTIVETGSKVRDFKVGDKVIAFGWNNNYAEYFKAKAWEVQLAPQGLDMDIVSLGEPVASAIYSGLNSGVQLGDTVVVMGAGFSGQIIAQIAKKKGAYQVIVVDILDGKLDLAKKLGADIIINRKKIDPIWAIKKITKGMGADVVIEAAGTEQSINQSSELIKQNGKFVWSRWVTTPVKLNISRWHENGLEFINPTLIHHTVDERYIWTKKIMNIITKGLIDIKPLITHEFKLEQIKKAFDFVDKDDHAVKVVLRP